MQNQHEVLDAHTLAPLLGVAVSTVLKDVSRAPWRLPPMVRIPGRQGARWLRSDVFAWLKSLRQDPVPPPKSAPAGISQPGRRGRPTQVERMEAARLGVTVKVLRANAEAGRGV